MATRFDAQFPVNLRQTQVNALSKPTINDFKVGFVYSVMEKIGNDNVGTTTPDGTQPTEAVYLRRDVVVQANTILEDLIEFQAHLRAGDAYVSPNNGTTTVP